MKLFDKVKGCKIIKQSYDAKNEVEELKLILEKSSNIDKTKLESQIRKMEYGIKGEEAILFELKNSGFPMLVLHDLYLEHDGLTAQIDYLILTREKAYIIESKNMYGDVTIRDTGDFYRKINGKSEKIYSPITQCDRHVELIKKLRYSAKDNFVSKMLFEKYGVNNYCSLVVMANPTCKINKTYAPKDIKHKIISVDQLVRHIKKNHNVQEEMSEKQMLTLGDFFLNAHKQNPQNYMTKYRDLNEIQKEENNTEEEKYICEKCGSTMVLRVAKKGNNAGNEFYGCSSYPKCKNIISK